LSGRILPVETFPTKVLALKYLYGILCLISNLPPREYIVQKYDLVHINYDKEYVITQNEFITYFTGNKRLTFFASMAFDKDY
ncbi:unnamed protein product, partial [Rotaria sp. Silwood2]